MPREIERVTYFTGYTIESLTLEDDGTISNVEVIEQEQDDVHEVYYVEGESERLDNEHEDLDEAYFDYFS